MITVDYYGRAGNKVFQYVFANLLAKKFDDEVYTPLPETFIPLKPYHKGSGIKKQGLSSIIGESTCVQALNGDYYSDTHTHLHLHGYFQHVDLYNDSRADILPMFDLPPVKKYHDDLVVHLRLTDYWWYKVASVISPKWYLDIINSAHFKKCYIVVEKHPTNNKYLHHFNGIKGVEIVTGGSPLEDFLFIRNFDRIVCSNSTFCWWAAFLSDASKIYMFKKWMNHRKLNLPYIDRAKIIDGEFHQDRKLKDMKWSEYWVK